VQQPGSRIRLAPNLCLPDQTNQPPKQQQETST
jgi:hypothetical protein